MRSKDNIVDSAEIRYLTKRSKELLTRAKKLSRNLKELSHLPVNTGQLVKEQVSLRKELNKLKRENRTLDKLEKGKKVNKSIIDKRRGANSKKIATIEAKVSENDTKIKSLSTGGKVGELSENIKGSLIDFKREIAKLETEVKNLRKARHQSHHNR